MVAGLDISRPPEHDLRHPDERRALRGPHRHSLALPAVRLPNWRTTYGCFVSWRENGVFEQLTGPLRRLVRESEGRIAEPSAWVLDSRTVKTFATVHLAGSGPEWWPRAFRGKAPADLAPAC